MSLPIAVKVDFSPKQRVKEGRSVIHKGPMRVAVYDINGQPVVECPECQKSYCELRTLKYLNLQKVVEYSVSRCKHLDDKFSVYLVSEP